MHIFSDSKRKYFAKGRKAVVASILAGVTMLYGCTRFEAETPKKNNLPVKSPALIQQACAIPADDKSSDLVTRLDSTLLKTKEAKGWSVSDIDRCRHKFPYRFIVVSSSPAVVIGLPTKSSSDATCLSVNCLRSKRFIGYYEVADKFTHVPGLVWFSPEHGARLFDVPPHANSIFLMLNGKTVRLKKKGNEWMLSKR